MKHSNSKSSDRSSKKAVDMTKTEGRKIALSEVLSTYKLPKAGPPKHFAKAFFGSLNAHLDLHRRETLTGKDFALLSRLATKTKTKTKRTQAEIETARKLAAAALSVARRGSGFAGTQRPPWWSGAGMGGGGGSFLWPSVPWRPPAPITLPFTATFNPPYTLADPYEERIIPGVLENGLPYNRVDALADNDKGFLSIATAGGKIFFEEDYQVDTLFSGIEIPMPERWGFGDSTSVRATFLQIVDLTPYILNAAYGATFSATADIKCPWMDSWDARLIYCFPGPSPTQESNWVGSDYNGLIALVCFIHLTITVGGAKLAQPAPSVTTTYRFMYYISNTDATSTIQELKADYDPQFIISAQIANLPKGVETAAISVSADAIAVRPGVNDQYGGFIGVNMRDATKTEGIFPIRPPDGYMNPQPIEIPAITASLMS